MVDYRAARVVAATRAQQSRSLHRERDCSYGGVALHATVVLVARENWRLGVGAAVVLVIGAVAGGAIVNAVGTSSQSSEVVIGVDEEHTESGELLVDVQGAVERPGIVVLAPGARVVDAISGAGGFSEDAASDSINLAREVQDGEQLLVPVEGEAEAVDDGNDLININRATAEELQQLPRVGPSVSAAIVAHRDEHGPFSTVDQLEDVSGIGPAMMEQLRPLVTV